MSYSVNSSISSSQSPSPSTNLKSEQIIQNFYSKFAQIIVQSRSTNNNKEQSKTNKWFNIEMVDIDALKQELKFWRAQAIYTPQPLILDVYVDLSQLDYSSKQLYLNSKRINVDSLKSIDASGNMIQKTCILLETWQLHATHNTNQASSAELPSIYKKCVSFFRSLFSFTRLLPAFQLFVKLKENKWNVKLGYRLATSKVQPPHEVPLNYPLDPTSDVRRIISEQNFGTIPTPYGMFSLNCLYRTECNFMILEKVQSLSQEALDYSRRKSFDRIPNSLSRHPSLILSTSQTNRNYIIPRPRHEFERTDSSLRSPYLYGSQQRGNSFSSNSPKNTPTQEINPYSLNYNSASLTHRTPLSTEHLLGTEFDLSNPPFDIDVPKKTDSVSSRNSETRTTSSLIRRTTHNLTTAPISFNQKQAFSSSSTPPVPGIFSQSQSFISTRSFNSNQQSNPNLLPIPSHHQLTSHSNRQQEESAQDHLYTEKEDQDRLAFMSNINEKRSGRSKIVSSQSGLFKMDQIIDDKEDNCSKPNLFIQKYAEMKQVNTSFHESICHQPTLPPTTISSSLPEKNRLDHRERVTTYPTRNYTESETRIKRENDIFEEDDATQDMIFDIQFS